LSIYTNLRSISKDEVVIVVSLPLYHKWKVINSERLGQPRNNSHLYILYNRNCNLQTSKAPLESQAQGTSLFTSAGFAGGYTSIIMFKRIRN